MAILKCIRKLIRGRSGSTAIEYGLIAAGIAIVILPAINNFGTTLSTTFTGVASEMNTSSPPGVGGGLDPTENPDTGGACTLEHPCLEE